MTHLILAHGSYLLIVAVLVLTGAGLPVPEEVPVITAGIMASHGQLDPWLAFAACLVGALAGDSLMYLIGYCFGRGVLEGNRHWVCLVSPEREARVERLIAQHDLKVLFLARFLVGLRSPVYLAAGILRLRFRRFFLMDVFCAGSVIGVFFLLSYLHGQTIVKWVRHAEIAATATVLLALGAAAFVWWRWRRGAEAGMQPTTRAATSVDAEPANRSLLRAEKVA